NTWLVRLGSQGVAPARCTSTTPSISTTLAVPGSSALVLRCANPRSSIRSSDASAQKAPQRTEVERLALISGARLAWLLEKLVAGNLYSNRFNCFQPGCGPEFGAG